MSNHPTSFSQKLDAAKRTRKPSWIEQTVRNFLLWANEAYPGLVFRSETGHPVFDVEASARLLSTPSPRSLFVVETTTGGMRDSEGKVLLSSEEATQERLEDSIAAYVGSDAFQAAVEDLVGGAHRDLLDDRFLDEDPDSDSGEILDEEDSDLRSGLERGLVVFTSRMHPYSNVWVDCVEGRISLRREEGPAKYKLEDMSLAAGESREEGLARLITHCDPSRWPDFVHLSEIRSIELKELKEEALAVLEGKRS